MLKTIRNLFRTKPKRKVKSKPKVKTWTVKTIKLDPYSIGTMDLLTDINDSPMIYTHHEKGRPQFLQCANLFHLVRSKVYGTNS